MFEYLGTALLLLIISIFWDACGAASLISLQETAFPTRIYHFYKTYGIHIPVILNMNASQRTDICDQMIESDLLRNQGISKFIFCSPEVIMLLIASQSVKDDHFVDGNFRKERISPPKKIEVPVELAEGVANISEIAIECIALHQNQSGFLLTNFFVFYAYTRQTFFVSRFEGQKFTMLGYGELSPLYITKTRTDLEELYWSRRYHIEVIRLNRSHLVDFIERNNPLSMFLGISRLSLCTSVFDAEFYKKNFIRSNHEAYTVIQEHFLEIPLTFQLPELQSFPLSTSNIVCIGEQKGKEVRRYLTFTYDDENSVFVQRMEDNALVLEAYIKDIVVISNANSRRTSGQLNFELL